MFLQRNKKTFQNYHQMLLNKSSVVVYVITLWKIMYPQSKMYYVNGNAISYEHYFINVMFYLFSKYHNNSKYWDKHTLANSVDPDQAVHNVPYKGLLCHSASNVFWPFCCSTYNKCPKISNTKVSEKMTYANSADPDQTAPKGAVWSGSTLLPFH